jgi:Zn-dependent alcohol dehydrogenase
MKAQYVDTRNKTPEELAAYCSRLTGELNIVIEASGAADTALKLIPNMSRSSIYVMTGIPRAQMNVEIEAAQLVRQIVRYNQVIVGSVNSNRRHFEMALGDLGEINRRFGGMLTDMVTHRFKLAEFEHAFDPDIRDRIKTVVEIEPWDQV